MIADQILLCIHSYVTPSFILCTVQILPSPHSVSIVLVVSQVEVVVLSVADDGEEGNQMGDCYVRYQSLASMGGLERGVYVRAADSLPRLKYLFLYHEKKPLAFSVGAGPRGSFS